MGTGTAQTKAAFKSRPVHRHPMGTDVLQRIEACGVIAVLRGVEPETVEDVARAVIDGGISVLEITAESDDAMEMIETVDDRFGDEAIVGVGTVLDGPTARLAISAGASFVVSPTFDGGVVETCNRYGVPVAPGVFTPTEAQRAYEAGADLVKLFPAKTGGPDHLAAIRGPLPQLDVVPTGGVGPSNAGEYVEAGAVAVGAGGAVVDLDAVERGDFDAIEENARALVDAVDAARS